MAMGIDVVPTRQPVEERDDAGHEAAERDPGAHGEEDPERQVAVEEREAAGDGRAPGRDERGWVGHVLEAPDERLQPAQRAGLDAVADPGTVDLPADEPRLLQHLEVLGDGGLGERELVDDVTADARLAADEQAEDLDPGGVADRLGEERSSSSASAPSTGRRSGASFDSGVGPHAGTFFSWGAIVIVDLR